jgi:SAM-dependent methyltransferase
MNPHSGLPERVHQAISQYQQRFGSLTSDDLEALDAFHAGGRAATRELAAMAGVPQGVRLLDVGCGLGGPARTLAVEYRASVVGLDAALEMVQAAKMLNVHLGSGDNPRLMCAQGALLPLAPESFELIWMQHLLPSVADKLGLVASLERVLAPNGIIALHEVVALPGKRLDFPLPWADSPEGSYLTEVDELLEIWASCGLEPVVVQDWTARAIEWFDAPRPEAWRHLNLRLVLGQEAGLRARNLAKALREGQAQIVQAVFRRQGI